MVRLRAFWATLVGRAREVAGANLTPRDIGWAVAMGVFIGVLPLYGLHLPICIVLARQLRLNQVLTYAAALVAVLGLPLLMLTFIPAYSFIFTGSYYNNYSPSPILQAILVYAFYLLICLNPLATAFVTETILIDQQSAFFTTFPLSNGSSVPLLSPWMPYTLFCLFFSLIMILLSIQLVRRKETT